MGPYEKELKKIVEKHLGGTYYKFISPSRVGVADRICALPKGVTFWIEIKEDNDRLRSRQVRELMRLKKLGHHVYVIDSWKGVEAVTILMEKEIESANLR